MNTKRSKPFKKLFSPLAKAYFDFYSDSTLVKYPPNYKADISLKQRHANRATVFVLDKSAKSVPILHSRNGNVKASSIEPVNNVLKTKLYNPYECITVEQKFTARSRTPRRCSNHDCAVLRRWHYLSEDECRKIITRIVNKLNRRLFKGRACRAKDPERITVLACMHDKNTRRHFHLLFGIPPHISEAEFRKALHDVLVTEPFVYRRRKISRVISLANAIGYNVDPAKSQVGNPVIFEAWQKAEKERLNGDRTNKQDDCNNLVAVAA